MNETIGFEDFRLGFIAVWKRKVLCLAAGLLVFLVGLVLTLGRTTSNVYMATSTVYSAVFGSYEESVDAANAMLSYANVVESAKVCERAASIVGDSDLTASDIQRMIDVSTSNSTIVMTINAFSSDEEQAIEVANAVAEAFVIEIRTITGTDAIQTLDEASKAVMATNGVRKLWLIRAAAFAVGLILMIVIVFLGSLFSNKFQSVKQLELTGEPIVGLIPHMEATE